MFCDCLLSFVLMSTRTQCQRRYSLYHSMKSQKCGSLVNRWAHQTSTSKMRVLQERTKAAAAARAGRRRQRRQAIRQLMAFAGHVRRSVDATSRGAHVVDDLGLSSAARRLIYRSPTADDGPAAAAARTMTSATTTESCLVTRQLYVRRR